MQCDDDDHGRCINKSGSNIDNRGKMSNSHRAPALTEKKSKFNHRLITSFFITLFKGDFYLNYKRGKYGCTTTILL